MCDSPTQTSPNDADESKGLKTMTAKQGDSLSLGGGDPFLRSKTIGFGLSKMNSSHHQKNASTDLSHLKLNSNDDCFSATITPSVGAKSVYKKQEKERLDSWADLDSVSTII